MDDVRRFRETGTLLWVDAQSLDEEQTIDLLNGVFGFHELAVEDTLHRRQTPKVDEYEGYLFIVLHAVSDGGGASEVHVFLGPGYLVTLREEAVVAVEQTMSELRRRPELLNRGSDWLMYLLLDRVVDGLVPVMDRFDDELDELEDAVVGQTGEDVLSRIFQLRKRVVRLRRQSMQQRELVLSLARGTYAQVSPETRVYLRDVYDHLVRASEFFDGFRDLLAAVIDIHLSALNNRMNEIIKTLTLFSVILLPLSLIAGIYGMNFRHMPELEWRYGYPAVLGLMVVVTVGLLAYFRRRRWL